MSEKWEDAMRLAAALVEGTLKWKDLQATARLFDWDIRRSLMAHDSLAPFVEESGALTRDGLESLRAHLEEREFSPDEADGSGLASLALRREIVQMLKFGKYAKPFEDGRFAWFSLVGTEDWQDYASLVLQMIQVDTLLNIEERLDHLLSIGNTSPQDVTDESAN